MIDRKSFFDAVRVNLFGSSMTKEQIDGCNVILDEWDARPQLTDIRWLAYKLATAKWETAHTMQPVREAYYLNPPGPHQNDATGKAEAYRKTLRYYPHYGRGYVQLTWPDNYAKMAVITGADLVGNPDLAMEPKIAATIMFEGMERGTFTGLGLLYFFNGTTDDPVGARKIINGTDHDEDIAVIHRAFLEALTPCAPKEVSPSDTVTDTAGNTWTKTDAPAAPRVLRKGDTGADVMALQKALGITPDGDFGPQTDSAVRLFQADRGLVADGIAGAMTMCALGASRET